MLWKQRSVKTEQEKQIQASRYVAPFRHVNCYRLFEESSCLRLQSQAVQDDPEDENTKKLQKDAKFVFTSRHGVLSLWTWLFTRAALSVWTRTGQELTAGECQNETTETSFLDGGDSVRGFAISCYCSFSFRLCQTVARKVYHVLIATNIRTIRMNGRLERRM